MTLKQQRGRPPHPDVLTPTEWRVAEAVRHGLTNRAIAARMGVSADAVKYHVGNVLSKLGFASRAKLRRWDGVRNDSNLARGAKAMAGDVQLGTLGQIARSVSAIDSARDWYRDKLGLAHLYSFEKLAFFDCGGVRLMLAEGSTETNSILYFRVPDIRAAHAALQERGIEFVSAPHMIHRHEDGTEEWMGFFNDNDGRPLAIMAQVKVEGEDE